MRRGEEPLRVVLTCDWFFYYSAALANELAELCDVLVVTRTHGYELGLEGDATAVKRAMLRDEVRVVWVDGRQSNPFTFADVRRACRAVGDFRPDIVHAQTHGDWRLHLVERHCASPFFVTIHDVIPHSGATGHANVVQRAVSHRQRVGAAGLVVHGARLQKQVVEQNWYVGTPVFSVPHVPLDLPDVVPPLPKQPTLLLFGRLEPYKGLDVFIRAVELVADRGFPISAIVAGRGSDAERCRSLVRRPELFAWRIGFIPDEALPSLMSEVSPSCSI